MGQSQSSQLGGLLNRLTRFTPTTRIPKFRFGYAVAAFFVRLLLSHFEPPIKLDVQLEKVNRTRRFPPVAPSPGNLLSCPKYILLFVTKPATGRSYSRYKQEFARRVRHVHKNERGISGKSSAPETLFLGICTPPPPIPLTKLLKRCEILSYLRCNFFCI